MGRISPFSCGVRRGEQEEDTPEHGDGLHIRPGGVRRTHGMAPADPCRGRRRPRDVGPGLRKFAGTAGPDLEPVRGSARPGPRLRRLGQRPRDHDLLALRCRRGRRSRRVQRHRRARPGRNRRTRRVHGRGEDPLPTTPTKKIGAFTNTIVDGLKADTVYRIAVAAFSTSGIGPKSAVLTVRTQTAAA